MLQGPSTPFAEYSQSPIKSTRAGVQSTVQDEAQREAGLKMPDTFTIFLFYQLPVHGHKVIVKRQKKRTDKDKISIFKSQFEETAYSHGYWDLNKISCYPE